MHNRICRPAETESEFCFGFVGTFDANLFMEGGVKNAEYFPEKRTGRKTCK
jgi:hypothetical protein